MLYSPDFASLFLDESCLASAADDKLSVGDAACVVVDWQTMRALQNGHGGVNDSMRQVKQLLNSIIGCLFM